MASEAQTTALMLVPKFTAAASVIGSSCILGHVIYLWRKSKTSSSTSRMFTTRHRLLAGMSTFDIFSSTAWFLTSWPMPKWVFWAKWNYGTQQTCTAQGFFVQFGMGTICYNACLTLYYLLVIRYGMRNSYISRHYEKWMHLSVIIFVFVTSITSLVLELFNPIGWTCWINANPPWCVQSHQGGGTTDCVRGDNARLFSIFFWYLPSGCIMVFCIVCMLLIFFKIRAVEQSIQRNAVHPGRLQRKFVQGALLYVGAMFLAWSVWTGVFIHQQVSPIRINWWLSFTAAVLLPTQGAFNALIYFRGSLFSNSNARPEQEERLSIMQRVRQCLCCCCVDSEVEFDEGTTSNLDSTGRTAAIFGTNGALWQPFRRTNRSQQSTTQEESQEEAAPSSINVDAMQEEPTEEAAPASVNNCTRHEQHREEAASAIQGR